MLQHTLRQVLVALAARWPRAPAILGAGVAWDYAEYRARVNQAAWLFHQAGVRAGDNVGLLLTNVPEFPVALLACHTVGAAAALWNFRLARRDVERLIAQARPRAMVLNAEFVETVAEARATLGACRFYVTGEEETAGIPAFFVAARSHPTNEPPTPEIDPDHVSSVIYTSGTTGRQKGAAYTQRTQLLSAIQYSLEMGLDRGRRGLSAAPLLHGGALNYFMAFLHVGAVNVLSGPFDPHAILEAIETHRVTDLMAVPTQIEALLQAQVTRPRDLQSLRLLRTAGARYPLTFIDRIRAILGCEVLNTYGMTENCANTTAYWTAYDPYEKRDAIGVPTYFWEARVIRADPDRVVPPDEVITPPGTGQLIVRGPQNITAYYQQPEEPLADVDGWLYTRDIVFADADGYLYHVDRIDNIIKSGAENIYPQEVEAVLLRHPKVADAAVLGLPDPQWGETVAAMVQPAVRDLTVDELEAYCRTCDDLARFKRPRTYILVDDIPKNIFGKTDRQALKRRAAALGPA